MLETLEDEIARIHEVRIGNVIFGHVSAQHMLPNLTAVWPKIVAVCEVAKAWTKGGNAWPSVEIAVDALESKLAALAKPEKRK